MIHLFDRNRWAKRNLPTKKRQQYIILSTLLRRTGQEVSVLDLINQSKALQYNARIKELRHFIYTAMGKPQTIDVINDIIINTLYNEDDNVISTYTLNHNFKHYAMNVLKSYEKGGQDA
jgi:hypothetical protein